MTLTREQFDDLHHGDLVDVTLHGSIVRHANGELSVGGKTVFWGDGRPSAWTDGLDLTVVSRAPRPLHDCPDCTHAAVTA